MAEIEINTKIFRKDNLDIVYSITGKKLLNGNVRKLLNL